MPSMEKRNSMSPDFTPFPFPDFMALLIASSMALSFRSPEMRSISACFS